MTAIITPTREANMEAHLIASGLGLATRQQLSGLCALLEAASLIDVARGAGAKLVKWIGMSFDDAEALMTTRANELFSSSESEDVLRHRLWIGLVNALGTRNILPLSERKVIEEANALGVMASRALSAGLHAKDEVTRRDGSGRDSYRERLEDQIKRLYDNPVSAFKTKPPITFPEIVAREMAEMLENLDFDTTDGAFDPEIEDALRRGGKQAWAGVAAAGGWVAMATAVNTAGFAPYILAAKASAFLPFVGGPAAVSFLAVMVNPVTIAAGLLALGGFGGSKVSATIKRQVSARIVVLLALGGLEHPHEGLGRTTTAFRQLCSPGKGKPKHLRAAEWSKIRSRATRVETEIGRAMPDAPGREPPKWRATPAINRSGANTKEVAAVLGLTAAEMFYHAAAIDPRVLDAADFWRKADISNQLEFATHALEFAVRGSDIALRGFTAEQVVLGNLVAQGHHVALPDSSGNPGFDLIVDGQEVQVKCGLDVYLLKEHFEKYPDIPVIANVELAAEFADYPNAYMVTSLEGFELAAVAEMTDRSVEAGIDLMAVDALAEAIGVGAVRGTLGIFTGAIPADHLPAWLVVDTAVRGALVIAGGQAGAVLGLVVIGPAGALVLGPVLGAAAIFGNDNIKGWIDGQINTAWYNEMRSDADELRLLGIRDLKSRIALLVNRWDKEFRLGTRLPKDLSIWLDRRAADDAIAASEDLLDLDEVPSTLFDAMCIDIAAARATPASPDILRLRQVLQKRLSEKPGPLDGVLKRVGWY